MDAQINNPKDIEPYYITDKEFLTMFKKYIEDCNIFVIDGEVLWNLYDPSPSDIIGKNEICENPETVLQKLNYNSVMKLYMFSESLHWIIKIEINGYIFSVSCFAGIV